MITKMKERLNTILALDEQGFDLDYTKCYSEKALQACMAVIAVKKLHKVLYENHELIQKELLNNPDFPQMLEQIQDAMEEVPVSKINEIIKDLLPMKQRITDYSFENVFSALESTSLNEKASVAYMTYEKPEKECNETIINNLNTFCLFADYFTLSKEAQALFIKPFLYRYIHAESDNPAEICELLAKQPDLMAIAEWTFQHAEHTTFRMNELLLMKEEPQKVLYGINKVHELFYSEKEENDGIENFLYYWRENCSVEELSVTAEKLAVLSMDDRQTAVQSRSAYISLLYGKAVKGLDLTSLNTAEEDVIVYALSAGKKAFIRLIEQNTEAFLSLPYNTLLFNKDFFKNYINLNSLNAKNLKGLMCIMDGEKHSYGENDTKLQLGWLEKREHTFEEIKTLHSLERPYVHFYNSLSIQRVDDRLLALRQIVKKQLLSDVDSDEEIKALAAELSKKPLYKRVSEEFSHIDNIQVSDVIKLLIHYDKVKMFIDQMNERLDVALILRIRDIANEYKTLDDIKSKLVEIDPSWEELKNLMGFDDDFLKRNQKWIIKFLVQDGAQIALTYFKNGSLSESQKESYKRIIKAEVMGEFNTLKYFRDDLALEIDYPLKDCQTTAWQKNLETDVQSVFAKEYDDFYGTMLMGIQPQSTCLNYIDGAYRECLMSNFDTNKKVFYAETNGKIIGRAILRLTKGRFNDADTSKHTESLSFVDVEALPEEREVNNKGERERMALFLERPYRAGASPVVEKMAGAAFIKLAEAKADSLNAMLVLSQAYEADIKETKEEYAKTQLSLYISKSKAGNQYIDSLSGSAQVSDEGSYRSNVFLIRKKDL